jgi:selenocysteine lyase/cysteine desulfurase
LQYRLEYLGVYDRTPQMVLPETIQFLGQIGLDRLRDRAFALARFARSTLADIGWVCRNAPHPAMSGCMSIFALPDHVDPNTFAHRLWTEHRILCPVTRVGESHFLRVSTGWFNTIDDIRRLSGALRSFM